MKILLANDDYEERCDALLHRLDHVEEEIKKRIQHPKARWKDAMKEDNPRAPCEPITDYGLYNLFG